MTQSLNRRRVLAAIAAVPAGSASALGGTPAPPEVFVRLAQLTIRGDEVQTAGFERPGIGAAVYRLTSRRGETRWRTRTADGRWFELDEAVLSPEMFGAIGDGVHDSYDALLSMSECISERGVGRIVFAKDAHYRINRHRIEGGPQANKVRNLVWSDFRELSIDLNGSRIDVDGRFHRALDRPGRFPPSSANSVNPFIFRSGRNLSFRNGVIDLNVQDMTRSEDCGEGDNYGFQLQGVEDFVVENVETVRCPTDGYFITADIPAYRISKRGLFLNVRSRFNGRQAVSVTGGREIRWEGGLSSYSGYQAVASDGVAVQGPYGAHDPGAGLDLEPDIDKPDARSGSLTFVDHVFEENHGLQLVAGSFSRSDGIELVGCTFRLRTRTGGVAIGLGGRCVVRKCYFENVGLWFGYGAAGEKHSLMSGAISENRFKGSIAGYRALSGGDNGGIGSPALVITHNKISLEREVLTANTDVPIFLDKWPSARWEENVVVADNWSGSPIRIARLGVGSSRNNQYRATRAAISVEYRSTLDRNTRLVVQNDQSFGPVQFKELDTGRTTAGPRYDQHRSGKRG